ncbi:MAG: BadF/BadG/BcrA/BcrD ATPase family protein [Paracoccaceae bacterium]
MDQWIVGVDGGGSGCRVAALCGDVRREAAGGPANATTDEAGAIAAVIAAIRATGAGRGRAHLGLAGVLDRALAQRIASVVGVATGLACTVTDDRATTLAGALRGDGALAALGTGTITGVRRGGEARFAGGWGGLLSDHGSGAWLGRQSLMLALEAQDGLRPPSDLTTALLSDHGGPSGLVAFAQGSGPAGWATLAPRVLDAAEAGDPTGAALMRWGAARLSRTLRALGGADLPLCLTGGLGPRYAPWLPGWRLVPPAGTALDGALALALA